MAKQVLFVCVHNAGRSQMAEAFFNRLAEEQGLELCAESAGTEPGEHVHPDGLQGSPNAVGANKATVACRGGFQTRPYMPAAGHVLELCSNWTAL